MSIKPPEEVFPGYCRASVAAKVIGVSESQLSRYIHAGRFANVKKVGQQHYIPVDQLSSFRRPRRGNPAFVAKKASRKKK